MSNRLVKDVLLVPSPHCNNSLFEKYCTQLIALQAINALKETISGYVFVEAKLFHGWPKLYCLWSLNS